MGSDTSNTTGMTITKMLRHGSTLATDPPTVGPIAGATVMTSEPTPIRRPTFECGDCSRMMLIISGVAMPEPTPWTTRAHRITGNECPTIMRHDPSTARMTAAMNVDFMVNRRLRYDEIGIVTPTTSR